MAWLYCVLKNVTECMCLSCLRLWACVCVCLCTVGVFKCGALFLCDFLVVSNEFWNKYFMPFPLVKKSSLLQQQNSCEQQPTHMRCLALARSGPPKECESGRATETEREWELITNICTLFYIFSFEKAARANQQ